MALSMMREHIQLIRQAKFDPMTYEGHGYVRRGPIWTDGFRLHLSTFKCGPDQIKVLGLDLSQIRVVGISALLPEIDDPASTTTGPGRKDDDDDMSSSFEDTTPTFGSRTYYNLAVKQKAVYQPTFKHRR
ncbi:hypothetical protein BC939DRAFT_480964 [Gamsiella multidivaricata]|uniref:uncharacterized protein n=1 Tax=Gamsiella multidivaricata TaxID=101098 RepID=UPI002220303D|nr:uncharacterized protein BC939DRAFT_480964 [Gamsiella multidivaricata]KAI7817656.1 hypothetical protein BC939DRAFT_480964 [Gamsiella multidivaricata]